ncbi:hypothetical protein F183_A27720 [Bryobacterales bacterium F-183]|nr:hypothetical protein F183_A27720 [Bryobacterales bacterium F-183]
MLYSAHDFDGTAAVFRDVYGDDWLDHHAFFSQGIANGTFNLCGPHARDFDALAQQRQADGAVVRNTDVSSELGRIVNG